MLDEVQLNGDLGDESWVMPSGEFHIRTPKGEVFHLDLEEAKLKIEQLAKQYNENKYFENLETSRWQYAEFGKWIAEQKGGPQLKLGQLSQLWHEIVARYLLAKKKQNERLNKILESPSFTDSTPDQPAPADKIID
jgi:hypothetical protein